MAETMKPCPFENGTCDPDALVAVIAPDPSGRKDIKSAYVECCDCGARGPLAFAHVNDVQQCAIYSWNDRQGAAHGPR